MASSIALEDSKPSASDVVRTGISAKTMLLIGLVFSLAITALIAVLTPLLDRFVLLPDQGPTWYVWKLPVPTLMSRATAWGGYLIHQIGLWGLIWYAQARVEKYTSGLHPINIAALTFNGLMIGLHLLQTHIWYDGLAQDVSIFSSQGSVIVLLVWVLLMETPRRGLFFGKKVKFSEAVIRFARKYHGYFFAWAAVYTFWYHPMVSTPGHLIGFMYMFMLLLQGSLFLTRIHTNKWWTFAQEITVLIHGTMVAVVQGADLWPMFLFGFGGIFLITQMHGLGLPNWLKWVFFGLFVAGVVVVYNGRWLDANEVIRIPVIDYLSVFVLFGLLWFGMWLTRFVRDKLNPQPEAS